MAALVRLLGELKGEGVALVVIEHHMELPRVLQAYLGSAQ
ncbi:ABC transporter ATP-binding protein [Bordetella pertussis]|nr:ABC transporter ATP-binding protein [Bordetella pertussis]